MLLIRSVFAIKMHAVFMSLMYSIAFTMFIPWGKEWFTIVSKTRITFNIYWKINVYCIMCVCFFPWGLFLSEERHLLQVVFWYKCRKSMGDFLFNKVFHIFSWAPRCRTLCSLKFPEVFYMQADNLHYFAFLVFKWTHWL